MPKRRASQKRNRSIANSDIRVREIPAELHNEIRRENGARLFGVTIDSEFLRTPNGTIISHSDERAMRELAAELEYTDDLDVTRISLFNLISTQIEFVEKNRQEFSDAMLTSAFLNDPVLKPCAGPEVIGQMKYLQLVVDYLKGIEIKYPNLPQIPLGVEWLQEEPLNEGFNNNFQKLVKFAQDTITQFSNWELTVFITVAHAFNSPTLGLMLAKKKLTPNEFAVTYYTSQALNSKVFGDTERMEERALVEACTKHAECMIRYIDQFSLKETQAEQIILAGESKNVEFKSTLRWNIRAKQNDEKIEHEVLKTIAAFLNTDGGTLLVGVEDNGSVLGMELDGFANEDKYQLYFKDLLVTKIGREYFDLVKYSLEPAKEKKVLLVQCKRSSKPAFVKHEGKEDFYIRTGPSSAKLSPSEMLEYSKTRFS